MDTRGIYIQGNYYLLTQAQMKQKALLMYH
jgi:hypothetical protein